VQHGAHHRAVPDSWDDSYEDIVITGEGERTVEYVGTVVWFQPAEEME